MKDITTLVCENNLRKGFREMTVGTYAIFTYILHTLQVCEKKIGANRIFPSVWMSSAQGLNRQW